MDDMMMAERKGLPPEFKFSAKSIFSEAADTECQILREDLGIIDRILVDGKLWSIGTIMRLRKHQYKKAAIVAIEVHFKTREVTFVLSVGAAEELITEHQTNLELAPCDFFSTRTVSLIVERGQNCKDLAPVATLISQFLRENAIEKESATLMLGATPKIANRVAKARARKVRHTQPKNTGVDKPEQEAGHDGPQVTLSGREVHNPPKFTFSPAASVNAGKQSKSKPKHQKEKLEIRQLKKALAKSQQQLEELKHAMEEDSACEEEDEEETEQEHPKRKKGPKKKDKPARSSRSGKNRHASRSKTRSRSVSPPRRPRHDDTREAAPGAALAVLLPALLPALAGALKRSRSRSRSSSCSCSRSRSPHRGHHDHHSNHSRHSRHSRRRRHH